jgi:hypothetical protein
MFYLSAGVGADAFGPPSDGMKNFRLANLEDLDLIAYST